MKKTGWYSEDQIPVRVGWYQRQYGAEYTNDAPDFFDGKDWFIGLGENVIPKFKAFSSRPWRGIQAPKKAKK